MPRPYLGVKSFPVKLLPRQIEQAKEIARLRSIRAGKRCDASQAFRDALDEGLKRLKAAL